MSLDIEILEIIAGLIERTSHNEVNWELYSDPGGSEIEDDFIVNFPDYSVNVWKHDEGAGFAIVDSAGRRIFSRHLSSEEPDYSTLLQLAELASLTANHVIDAIEHLKQELAKEGPVGKKSKTDEAES